MVAWGFGALGPSVPFAGDTEGSRDLAASIMNTANSKMSSGSFVFFALARYSSSVLSWERRAAEFPGRRWAGWGGWWRGDRVQGRKRRRRR
jgi:hypothetical protein